jgi:uncharacterized protein
MTGERERDPEMIVWWATEVECEAAIARVEREGVISALQAEQARDLLAQLVGEWREVEPGDLLRRGARRLLRTHPLRAADSLQLAAAIVASDAEDLEFVTLDGRLAEAARREGFRVTPQQQV